MKNKEGISLKIIHDKTGRIVCDPYSDDNLRDMATKLKIKPCWKEKTHYQIPPFRVEEITKKSSVKSEKFISQFIKKNNK